MRAPFALFATLLLGCGSVVRATDPPGAADGAVDPPGADASAGAAEAGSDDAASIACTPPRCSLEPQCGCAQGAKCDVLIAPGAASVLCVDAGTLAVGQACQQPSDCLPGVSCLSGACRPFCSAPNNPCAGGSSATPLGQCYQVTVGAQPIPRAYACQLACTPYPSTCGPGTTCVVGITSAGAVVDCQGAGASPEGGSCTTARDCAPGLGCTQEDGAGVCTSWCRLVGAYADCAAGKTCTALTATPVIGGVSYGYCG